jgi:hypothetical protein
MNATKLLLSASSVGLALAFCLPVQAKVTTNKITTNKITTNKVTTNKIATNKYAIAGRSSSTTTGDGAFSAVDAIVLSDGRRLSR